MDRFGVEFMGLGFLFSDGLSSTVMTNLLLKSYCLLMPNLTEANCSGVIPSEIENLVQPHVADQQMLKTLIESFLPGFAVLFVGPWSDIKGRRPILMLSFFGTTLSYCIWAVLSLQLGNINPYYYLTSSICIGLTGGSPLFFMAIMCIVNDTTSATEKTFKMSSFEGGCLMGVFFSQLLTAKLSAGPYGFVTTFSVSAAIQFSLLLYVFFFFPETVVTRDNKKFSFDVFKTFFKSRVNRTTTIMILLVIAHLTYITIIFGEGGIFYLNMQKRFGWSITEFSEYVAYSVIIGAFYLFCVSWFITSFLKLGDFKTLMIASAPRIFSSLVVAFTTNWKLVYVSMGIGCLSLLITPAYRSKMSKLVPPDEFGKVVSFMSFTESMIPVAASTLYTTVYDRILDVFPGGIFLISSALISISFLCVLTASIISWYHPTTDFSLIQEVEASDDDILSDDSPS